MSQDQQKYLNKIVTQFLLGLIKVYRLILSPWFGSACRYNPSCSRYAEQAIMHHGIVKGLYLSMMRILRCHPWGGQGDDPVPIKQTNDD